MYKLIIFSLAIATVISSPTTPVRKCKATNENLFKEVVVKTSKGICTSLPCNLVSGEDVVTDMNFIVKSEVKKITIKCNATVSGFTIDFPIPNADEGCDMLTNTYCPVEPDSEADLSFKMHVSKMFPKIPVDLVIYTLDQNKKMISCFEVPIKVIAK